MPPARIIKIVGVTAIVAGSGLTMVSPASAASVPDAASLRAAITSLNGTGPAAEIELAPGVIYALPGGTACDDEDDNLSGDLDVRRTQALKIFTPDGARPAILRMDCDPATSPQRILDVKAPPGLYGAGKLTLRNVILRNGHAPSGAGSNDGGAVRTVADVTVENTRFENNTAGGGKASITPGVPGERGGAGGAIATFGLVTIEGSTFRANEAGSAAAGFSTTGPCTAVGASGGGPGGAGGAVFAAGGAIITNSTFSLNRAGNGGAGGNEACVAGENTAGDNTVAENTVAAAGTTGGNGGSGGAFACGTALIGQTYRCRGNLTVRGSTFTRNRGGAGGAGGNAVSSTAGFGSMVGDIVGDIAGGVIGGLAGEVAGQITGENTRGSTGIGGDGGAIQILGQAGEVRTRLTLENSTFDANSTRSDGVATAFYAAFDQTPDSPFVLLTNVTMVGGNGNGILAVEGSPWTSTASVIGGGNSPDCSSAAQTPTSSMSTDDSCGFGAANVYPFPAFALAPLGSNGGPTQTRLPGEGSVLLDAVEWSVVPVDQRGQPRPQRHSDIGAVEVASILPPDAGATPPGDGTDPSGGAPGDGTDPSGTDPSGTDPSGTDPSGTDPSGTDPSGTDPSGTDPSSGAPGDGTDPSGTDPAGTWPATGTDLGDTPPDAPSTQPNPDPGPGPSADSDNPAADPAVSPQPLAQMEGGDGGMLTETGSRIGPIATAGALLVCGGVFMLIRYRRPGRHRLNLRLRQAT